MSCLSASMPLLQKRVSDSAIVDGCEPPCVAGNQTQDL